MSLKSILSMGVLLAATLVITYTWIPHGGADVMPVAERDTVQDFTLKDAIGNEVRLSDYRGKVVLLNFWATWCAPCRVEIPWFIDFEKNYKDKGFAVVGVSFDEDGWAAVGPYVEDEGMNYRVVVGDDAMAHEWNVAALPTTLILDREGRIAAYHQGLVSEATYESQIQRLLVENPDGSIPEGALSEVADAR